MPPVFAFEISDEVGGRRFLTLGPSTRRNAVAQVQHGERRRPGNRFFETN